VEQGVVVPAVGSEAEGEGINLDGGRGGGHKTGEDDEFGEHDRSNLSLQLPFWVNEIMFNRLRYCTTDSIRLQVTQTPPRRQT
jgi:hypothetical protein